MVYVDASVAMAEILSETRSPAIAFWDHDLVSSRLLEYEIWTLLHSNGLGTSHADEARLVLEVVDFVDMSPEVLSRALKPFPVGLRTLDALHLATMVFLRSEHDDLRLATYDERLAKAAKALRFQVLTP